MVYSEVGSLGARALHPILVDPKAHIESRKAVAPEEIDAVTLPEGCPLRDEDGAIPDHSYDRTGVELHVHERPLSVWPHQSGVKADPDSPGQVGGATANGDELPATHRRMLSHPPFAGGRQWRLGNRAPKSEPAKQAKGVQAKTESHSGWCLTHIRLQVCRACTGLPRSVATTPVLRARR